MSSVFRLRPQNGESFSTEEQQMEEPTSFLFKKAKQKSEAPKEEIEYPFEGENDLEREIERNIAQNISTIIETVGGTPGNIQNLISNITGFKFPFQSPTSRQLEKTSQELSGGYLTPQTTTEKKAKHFMEDIASFAMPGSKSYGILRNIGIPLAGAVGRETLENLDVDESNQDLAVAGLEFVLDLIAQRSAHGGGAKKVADTLNKAAEQTAQKVPTFSITPPYRQKVVNFIEKLKLGGKDPTKTEALNKAEEFLKKIDQNPTNFDINELIQTRRTTNQIKKSLKGFDPSVHKDIRKGSINKLDEFLGVLSELDAGYGMHNPEFYKLYKAGNTAHAAWAESNAVSNWLNKNFGDKVNSKALASVLGMGTGVGVGSYVSPLIGLMSGAAGATIGGGLLGYKYLSRIMKSPELANHYQEILKGAMSGNVSQASKHIHILDKELQKEEMEEKKRRLFYPQRIKKKKYQ